MGSSLRGNAFLFGVGECSSHSSEPLFSHLPSLNSAAAEWPGSREQKRPSTARPASIDDGLKTRRILGRSQKLAPSGARDASSPSHHHHASSRPGWASARSNRCPQHPAQHVATRGSVLCSPRARTGRRSCSLPTEHMHKQLSKPICSRKLSCAHTGLGQRLKAIAWVVSGGRRAPGRFADP